MNVHLTIEFFSPFIVTKNIDLYHIAHLSWNSISSCLMIECICFSLPHKQTDIHFYRTTCILFWIFFIDRDLQIAWFSCCPLWVREGERRRRRKTGKQISIFNNIHWKTLNRTILFFVIFFSVNISLLERVRWGDEDEILDCVLVKSFLGIGSHVEMNWNTGWSSFS